MSGALSGGLGGGELAAALGLALLWDLVLGEPPAVLSPRAWLRGLARVLARRLPRGGRKRELAGGVLAVLVVALLPALAAALLLGLLAGERHLAAFLVTVVLLRGTFSLLEIGRRSLGVLEALRVDTPFEAHARLVPWSGPVDLAPARDRLVCATFETMARRAAGEVIAPLFWFAVLGLPGALLQRGLEVLHEVLRELGARERAPFAAREEGADSEQAPALPEAAEELSGAADPEVSPAPAAGPLLARPAAWLHEILAFVPARLAALLLLVAAKALGEDAARGLALTARRAALPGPKAEALPMAALAGALGAPLGELDGRELGSLLQAPAGWLAEPRQPLAAARIHLAWRVVCLAAAAWAGLCALALWSAGGSLVELVRP